MRTDKPQRKARQAKPAHASAAKAHRTASEATEGQPPTVDTPEGRMVRTPAGFLIPEAQWLAMSTPPRQPTDPPPALSASLRAFARDLVDFHFNPDHPLKQPTLDKKVMAAGADGPSRRHEAETLAAEQIAAAMRAGAPRPSTLPQIQALSSVHVAVNVEIGNAWIDRGGDENFAISKVLYGIAVFHPEKAAKLAQHPDAILNAIRAWSRGKGRPRKGRPSKGEYQGSKWDAIAALCKLAGIRDCAPKTIKKAWERSGS